MVQFKSGTMHNENRCSRDYWKLRTRYSWNRNQLRAELGQIRHLSAIRKSRLLELCTRLDRGLIVYEGCSKDELKTYCLQRSIQTGGRPLKKVELVKLLEEADDGPSFVHFEDLPPELRDYIYQLHFESLTPSDGLARPPITQVSRIIRQESLPRFYKSSTFIVVIQNSKISCVKSLSQKTWRFVYGTSDEQIATIRRLSVQANASYNPTEFGKWIVDLRPKANRSLARAPRHKWFPISAQVNRRIMKKLRPIVDALRERTRLDRGDFARLAKVFQDDKI